MKLLKCGENTAINAQKALTNISQCLTSKGVYVCVSYG